MSVKFIIPSATGQMQGSILARVIEDVTTIDLGDNPDNGTDLNQVSIPFDGTNDHIVVEGDGVIITDFAKPMIGPDDGSNSSRIAFDGWFKCSDTGVRNYIFDYSIQRQVLSAAAVQTVSGFDGIYQAFILKDGASNEGRFEFRITQGTSYSATGTTSLSSGSVGDGTPFYHYYCDYSQATSTMRAYINGSEQFTKSFSAFDGNSNSAMSGNGIAYSLAADTFNGVLDELRIWSQTAAASSIGILCSVTSIGLDPSTITSSADIDHDNLISWWRFESTEAGELFNATPSSIEDYAFSDSGNLTALTASTTSLSATWGTPSGFAGADLPLNLNVIVSGLSATGNLIAAQGQGDVLFGGGGTLDHGGLMTMDSNDSKVLMEPANEPINTLKYGTWTTTGDTTVSQEGFQVWAGASAAKVIINDTSNTAGINIPISTSALIFSGVPYTASMRLRAVPRTDQTTDHSVSAIFTVGDNSVTTAVDLTTTQWLPVSLSLTAGGASSTGDLWIYNNASKAESFYVDGLNIVMSDYPAFFTAPDSLRKGSQLVYHISEVT